MPGADPEYQQQVAVFRYGVIADLLHAPPDAGSASRTRICNRCGNGTTVWRQYLYRPQVG